MSFARGQTHTRFCERESGVEAGRRHPSVSAFALSSRGAAGNVTPMPNSGVYIDSLHKA